MLRMMGVIVAIGAGLLALWVLVDIAWYLWGGLAALSISFALIFFLVYLWDRRKIKESEDLIAERAPFG